MDQVGSINRPNLRNPIEKAGPKAVEFLAGAQIKPQLDRFEITTRPVAPALPPKTRNSWETTAGGFATAAGTLGLFLSGLEYTAAYGLGTSVAGPVVGLLVGVVAFFGGLYMVYDGLRKRQR